jgi:glycosyltransferase involved in cell wall biosynthesis
MISILIPLYNGIEFIDESVSSVKNQTYEQWELIIGVNGHPENSEIYKMAQTYHDGNKIRILDLYHINGKSNALNEMLTYCIYDHVAILDVDDIWNPSKLMIQKDYLHYDVVGARCAYFGDKTGSPYIPVGDLMRFNFMSMNPIINSSAIIKKSLCYWNSKVDGVEDYNLWLRLWKNGCKFYNVDKILILHRLHNTSAFNAYNKNDAMVKDLLNKYI